jgi:hypothetical protein
VGHVTRILGDKMLVDVNEQTVKHYQDARLCENTGPPKSINEEGAFLLRIMDTAGDVLRVRLRKRNLLKQNDSPLAKPVQQIETGPHKSPHRC